MLASHIESVHIHLPPSFSPEAMAAMERLMERLGRTEPAPAAAAMAQAGPGNPPPPGHLWPGQGGYYICTMPAFLALPPRHLIAATVERDGLAWGGCGTVITGANCQVDGRANTIALLADGGHPAAEWVAKHEADGHSDFYLGSRLEMLMCNLYVPHRFKKEGWYLTSSQCSAYGAWCQDFENGHSLAYGKDYEFRAVPLRCIHL